MFCVLLNTGQTFNQSLAVQNVAFTNNFNLPTLQIFFLFFFYIT